MPTTNLGRIGFVLKGAWVAGTYKFLDVVYYSNATWGCSVATTTTTPGSGTDWVKLVDGSGLAFAGESDALAGTSNTVMMSPLAASYLLNVLAGAVAQATDMAAFAGRELDRLRKVYMQRGSVTIYNRGVKSGCAASKSTARKIDVALGQFFMDGRIYGIPAELADAVTVPDNNTGAAATCYVYLYIDSGDVAVGITALGTEVTSQGVELCSLTLPDGNTSVTDSDLGSVTLTDTRRVEASWPQLVDAAAFEYIALDYIFHDNDYQVAVDIDSFSGSMAQVGDILVEDRLRNGFKLYTTGTADEIVINYTASRLQT